MKTALYLKGSQYCLFDFEHDQKSKTYTITNPLINPLKNLKKTSFLNSYDCVYTNCTVNSNTYKIMTLKFNNLHYIDEITDKELDKYLFKITDLYNGSNLVGCNDISQKKLDIKVDEFSSFDFNKNKADIQLRAYLYLVKVMVISSNSVVPTATVKIGDPRHKPARPY